MVMPYLQNNPFLRKQIYSLGVKRAQRILSKISPYLEIKDRILDIGAGQCIISELLQNKQYAVTPLDIANLSCVDTIKPIVYDGETIPFADNEFDVSLLITVLHHTFNPQNLILEAKRVSKRVIVMEDVFSNIVHKHLTFFIDSTLNREFKGHPHSNKNDTEWQLLFNSLSLRLKDMQYFSSFLVLQHALYSLEK